MQKSLVSKSDGIRAAILLMEGMMTGKAHKTSTNGKPTREGDLDAVMAMPAEFGNELESARHRAESVRQVVGESCLQKRSLVLEAVEHLETTLEELPVAGETLRQQNDGILATRSELEGERQKYEGLNMEIEERVRRRTAELVQLNEQKDELLIRERRARSDAEAANRSKDEFLAMVAHELRTPLNAILGWAQLMRFEIGNEAQTARAGDVIERSAMVQARIINDILDVSRIVTGNLHLDMRSLDFAAVVRAAVEAARPAIDANGIHLDTLLDESIGAVVGDFSRLQEVVDNILSNSIKFTPAGGRIGISLSRSGIWLNS